MEVDLNTIVAALGFLFIEEELRHFMYPISWIFCFFDFPCASYNKSVRIGSHIELSMLLDGIIYLLPFSHFIIFFLVIHCRNFLAADCIGFRCELLIYFLASFLLEQVIYIPQ